MNVRAIMSSHAFESSLSRLAIARANATITAVWLGVPCFTRSQVFPARIGSARLLHELAQVVDVVDATAVGIREHARTALEEQRHVAAKKQACIAADYPQPHLHLGV